MGDHEIREKLESNRATSSNNRFVMARINESRAGLDRLLMHRELRRGVLDGFVGGPGQAKAD